MTAERLDALAGRGYRPDGHVFTTGRPDRATLPLRTVEGDEVVAKHYPDGRGAETFAAMSELWASSFGARRTPPGLPRPVEYLEDLSLLVMERVAGRPLLELDGPPVACVDRSIELLGDLHASDARPVKRRTASGVVRSLRRKAARLAELEADLAGPFGALVDRLEHDRPRNAPLGPAHGDFSARNVLVGRDELVLIDWDRYRLADPARDVAYFGAWSWASAVREGTDPGWSVLERAASAYDRLRPEAAVGARLGFYVAAGLARIAHGLVEVWRTSGDVPAALVAEAERWLR